MAVEKEEVNEWWSRKIIRQDTRALTHRHTHSEHRLEFDTHTHTQTHRAPSLCLALILVGFREDEKIKWSLSHTAHTATFTQLGNCRNTNLKNKIKRTAQRKRRTTKPRVRRVSAVSNGDLGNGESAWRDLPPVSTLVRPDLAHTPPA